MKIIKKSINPKNKHGFVILIPINEEDIWYLYNIILQRDIVRMATIRKIKGKPGEEKAKKITRKKLVLTMEVVEVQFQSDETGTTLSLKTKNLKENEWINLNQQQTLEVKLFQRVQIYKENWDQQSLQYLDQALAQKSSQDSLIALLDDGYASFFYLKENFNQPCGKLTKQMTSKKQKYMSIYNQKLEEFDKLFWRYLLDNFDLDSLKVIIFAGPGNAKKRMQDKLNNFEQYEKEEVYRQKAVKIIKKIMIAHTSSTFRFSIEEIYKDENIMKLMKDTKAMKESKKLQEFFQVLQKNPNGAVFGEKEVIFANERTAIKTLLITDGTLRCTNFKKRKQIIDLVEEIKGHGAEVVIFNEDHESGKKLKDITGIAAILRFNLNLEELESLENQEKNEQQLKLVEKDESNSKNEELGQELFENDEYLFDQ